MAGKQTYEEIFNVELKDTYRSLTVADFKMPEDDFRKFTYKMSVDDLLATKARMDFYAQGVSYYTDHLCSQEEVIRIKAAIRTLDSSIIEGEKRVAENERKLRVYVELQWRNLIATLPEKSRKALNVDVLTDNMIKLIEDERVLPFYSIPIEKLDDFKTSRANSSKLREDMKSLMMRASF